VLRSLMIVLALVFVGCTGKAGDSAGSGTDGGATDGGSGDGDGGSGDGGSGDGGSGDGGSSDGGTTMHSPQRGVLLVIADDLGVEASACYDDPVAERAPQPTIESLCARGVVFDRAWSNPICSPTRATLQTGRYAFHNGVGEAVGNESPGIPLDEWTIPMALDAQGDGWGHAVFGKWHLSWEDNGGADNPNLMGWSHFSGHLLGELDDYSDWPKTVDGVEERSTEYATTVNVDDAIDWIQAQDAPWVVWLAFNAPHTPMHLPPADLHSYGELTDDPAEISDNPLPYFEAMIEAMDTELGRLFTTLGDEQMAMVDVVYLGDNGSWEPVNQGVFPEGHGKPSLYQGGVHVPLVIAGPSVVDGGRRNDDLVDLVDVMPTVLELAAVDIRDTQPADKPLDGMSLLNVLIDPDATHHREWSMSEIWGPRGRYDETGQTVTDGSYKLIRFRDGTEQVYDLRVDPFELDDIAVSGMDSEDRAAVARLGKLLDGMPYSPVE